MVAEHAVKSGAVLRQGTEAVAPLLSHGFVAGAVVKDKESGRTEEIRARYVVVADGANSRFGRALGTTGTAAIPRAWPSAATSPATSATPPGSRAPSTCGTATATRCPATAGSSRWATAQINVGIGLLSTFRDFKSVNTTHIMNEFVGHRPRALGHLARGGDVGAHRRAAPDGRVGRTQGRTDLDRGRRCRRLDQPVQRRGHRLRLRDRPDGRRAAPRDARDRRRPGAATLPAAAGRRVRPVLQGGPAVRPGDRPARR